MLGRHHDAWEKDMGMRKETAFIIGFVAFTVSTAALIWGVALPNFKPVSFPQIASGTLDVGPMHHTRALTTQEVADLNNWTRAHSSGWGPLYRTPPSSGDAHLHLRDAQNKEVLVLTLWTGISAADWNNTVFMESPDGSMVRSESFSTQAFAPLRLLVDGFAYQHSGYP